MKSFDKPSHQHVGEIYRPGVFVDDLQLVLAKTPTSVWEGLRNQRIFISGGTGFIGCWLLEGLIWANLSLSLNLSLTVLSRCPDAFLLKAPHLATHPTVRLLQGDVCDLRTIDEPFDSIIHAATDVVQAAANPVVAFDEIVAGTRQTLELAARSGARRYLLTSSGAVYGPQPNKITHVPEDYLGAPATAQPSSAYGQAKRISEWMVQCYSHNYDFETKIARCFALIGPYLPWDAHFAVGNFMRDALSGQIVKVNGDGSAYRSYLYAADMVIWLLTILVDGSPGEAYNVGSEAEISIRELAEKVSNIVSGEVRVAISEEPRFDSPPQRYIPCTSKTRDKLQLLEYTDLQSAIRKTVDWAIQRQKCY